MKKAQIFKNELQRINNNRITIGWKRMQSLLQKLQTILITSIMFFSLFTIQNIQAPTNATVIPLWKTRYPIMDGEITEGPWRDGITKEFMLYNDFQNESLTTSITAIHTANKTFYMGIKLPFYLRNDSNFICTLLFRTNQSEPLWKTNHTQGIGHDIKEMKIDQLETSTSRDLHTEQLSGNISIVEDISNDFTYLYQNKSDGLSLELSLPIESLDLNGSDVNPKSLKKTDLFIRAVQYNTTDYKNFSQYRYKDNDYDYCTIKYRGIRQGSFYILLIGIPTLIIATINMIRIIYTNKQNPKESDVKNN